MITSVQRLLSFAQQGGGDPAVLLSHRDRGWRYIPIHPFADDHDLLQRIEWPAERCRSVDAYWELEGDVYLLQINAEAETVRPCGIYYRWVDGDGYVQGNRI